MKFLVWISYYSCWYCCYEGESFNPKKPQNYDIYEDIAYAVRFETIEEAQSVVKYLEEKEGRKATVLLEVDHG